MAIPAPFSASGPLSGLTDAIRHYSAWLTTCPLGRALHARGLVSRVVYSAPSPQC